MARGFKEPGDKPRRFYKTVQVSETEGGWGVRLDARELRTPGGARLALPARGLAEMVAAEWESQGETLELAAMGVTRLANTAIDSIPGAREAVAGQVADYAGSDLLCYFAEEPAALIARQEAAWGPVLARAEAEEGLVLVRASGIVHRPQPERTLRRVVEIALSLNDFALAGLGFATPLFGSAVLAIAVARGWLGGEEAFELSRLDEVFQEEKWGIDAEAAERTTARRAEAKMAGAWLALAG